MWAQIGMAGLSMVKGSSDGRKARKIARRNAKLNSEASWKNTMEEYRRLEMQQEYNLGKAKANVFASGLQMSGSSARAVSHIDSEQTKQLDWVKSEGKTRRDNILRGGNQQGNSLNSQAKWGGISSAIQYGMSAYSSYKSPG